MLHDAFMATARAQGEPADWKKTLILLAYEIKRAVDLGFSQREWEIARDSMLAGAEQAVNVESTRDSSDLVVSLASAVDTDVPMLSSALELELLKKVVADVTVEDLQKAFIADFNAGNYAYVLKLPAPRAGENLPSEAEVLKVAASAWAIPTRATTQRATVAPLLPAEPAPGQISSRTQDSDLGVTTVVFENGVVMHHHFTDYKKDQVLVQIILPGGVLEETAENHGISSVASLILDRPATNHLSSTQIRMVLSNKNVSVTGRIGMDSLSINVAGTPGDLPIGLQLVHALLTDGKLEPPALERWKTLSQQSLRGKPMLADPQLTDALTATVMGGDPRFSAMTPETIQRQHVFKSEDWFKRIADHAAVEVSVVGDMPADQAVSLGAAYFGSLPKRTGTFADLDPLRKLTRDPGPFTRTIHYTSIEPKALVMAGFIGCEEHDPQRRPLALAALILTDRMVQRIRFDQQLVYSIRCTSTPSHGLPGTGMLSASAPTDPKNADRLADQILGIIKDFAASGPSEDELATAKKQMANQLTTQMKDPRYWLAQLSELEYHHRSLDELKQLPGIYDTFTVADLRDAVKKCATDDRLIRLEVLPDGSAATKPTTDPAAGADPSVQN
jgi:zinc protease